jgi:glycosyltransferase involved in cell wall biosynthesis
VNERIRVLLLIKGLGVGGAERLLERAVPYFDRDRYDYRVAYFLPWKDALVPTFKDGGIPVHCLDNRFAADLGVFGRLIGLLRRERIELVHVHSPVPAVMTRLGRRAAGVRWIVYTEHNVPARYGIVTRSLNAGTYRMNDAVIAVSQEVAARVQPYVRNGRPRLHAIPNAVDVDLFAGLQASREQVRREFGFPADAPVIINVANLTAKKGHTHLLAAAKRVLERQPNARFLCVGQGPLAEELAAEAKRHHLDGQLVFAGFRPDAITLMAASDVFVLSSLHEGLPVSLLEAMALARPQVVTRVGGVPEVVVDGETGVLVESENPGALADGILGLLGDPARAQRMGEAARVHVRRRYGMGQMVKAVEAVYASVIEGSPARR